MPYTRKVLAQQRVWLDYRKLPDLPPLVREHSGKWATNEERQIICYRVLMTLDKAALEHDEIRERLTLDCEQLCAMIQASHNKLFAQTEGDDSASDDKKVQSSPPHREAARLQPVAVAHQSGRALSIGPAVAPEAWHQRHRAMRKQEGPLA